MTTAKAKATAISKCVVAIFHVQHDGADFLRSRHYGEWRSAERIERTEKQLSGKKAVVGNQLSVTRTAIHPPPIFPGLSCDSELRSLYTKIKRKSSPNQEITASGQAGFWTGQVSVVNLDLGLGHVPCRVVATESHNARCCGLTGVKTQDFAVQKWERKSDTQHIVYQGWLIRQILRFKNGIRPSRQS